MCPRSIFLDESQNGSTPLMQASGNDKPDCVRLLLEAGVDVNIKMWSVRCKDCHCLFVSIFHTAQLLVHDVVLVCVA
jgi:hypothetical protein